MDNALKQYEKRTKKNLVANPLASRLEACGSPGEVLAVLGQQVRESRHSDERWTKLLSPTINVIHSFSQILGDVTVLV